MNNRIREIRKTLKLSQQDFSDKIKISRSNLGNIETGAVSVTDRVIGDICSAFGVSEAWLRTGCGEMFRPSSRDDEIAEFVGKALADESESVKKQVLHVLSRLTDQQWEFFADIGDLLIEERTKNQNK